MSSRMTVLALHLATLATLAAAPVAVAVAQETPKPGAQETRPAPEAAPAPEAKPSAESRAREPRAERVPATVQLKVVITDQAGSTTPQKRQLDLRLAEKERFSLRSRVATAPSEPRLDVDVRAALAGDKVLLWLTVEYIEFEPRVEGGPDPRFTNFKFLWDGLPLDPGKPTVIGQTVDPVADRRVTVEVTPVVVR